MDECRVVKNGWRDRDTGPCHSLRRVKCHHGPGYTLYPPGYAPRKRESVAPVDSAGEMVLVGEGDGHPEQGALAWYRTVFGAALDAAGGVGWSRGSPVGDPRRRRTQRRYMEQCAALLGLSFEMEEPVSQSIAECLGVAWLGLSDQRRVYQSAQTYLERGPVIAAVLEMIPVDRSLSYRLLLAGFIAGLWGRPRRWDPG